MVLNNEPGAWNIDPNEPYFPIWHEGAIVGFCKSDYAGRIIESLNNDEERLRKALKIACADLISQSGGDAGGVDHLAKNYMAKAGRPTHGPKAIAALLRDRQADLDVSNEEFAKFCDSYRLSVKDLKDIYAGKMINNNLLGPLSRILGKSIDELVEVRDGTYR